MPGPAGPASPRVQHLPRPPHDRPTSAILSKRDHDLQPRRPMSALAYTRVQPTAVQAATQPEGPHYSWACGNVHGTGHMLGPIIPSHSGPSATVSDSVWSKMYQVPPRQAPYPANLRPQRTPGATTTTLLRSTLHIQVVDRLLDQPVPGATVLVVDARSFSDSKALNAGSTATRNTKTDAHGLVRCRVLANHR